MRKKRSDALPSDVLKANQKASMRKYVTTHKEVLKERQRLRRQNDPVYRAKQNETVRLWRDRKKAAGEWRDMFRNHHLKAKYGLSLEEYNQRLLEQDGVCAICKGLDPEGDALAVDHCHVTEINRGLLCGRCNKALGLFQDSPAVLTAAIQYLNQHQ